MTLERGIRWGPGLFLVLILALAPLIFSDFYLSAVITKALWTGIAAVSLIFLAGYVGMVSLGQVALYGIAGFTFANLVVADGGSKVALNPWLATLLGLAVAVAVGFFLGAIASRSYGIYFLMITLAFSVLVLLLLRAGDAALRVRRREQRRASLRVVGNPLQPAGAALLHRARRLGGVYVALRYIARAPLGLAFQGVRDDPARMRALGYNVPLLRAVAFAPGGARRWPRRNPLRLVEHPVLRLDFPIPDDRHPDHRGHRRSVTGSRDMGGRRSWLAVLDNWLRGIDFVGEPFNTVIGVDLPRDRSGCLRAGSWGSGGSTTGALQASLVAVVHEEEPGPLPLAEEAPPGRQSPVVPLVRRRNHAKPTHPLCKSPR